jgi:anti-anti-sigma factor
LWYALPVHKEKAMSITVDVHGEIASIVLSGGIDYSKQDDFKGANEQALSADGVTEIHVDFAQTNFLDSSGIRALVQLQKEADASGRSLILFNVNDSMRDVFEIGGFDKVFTFR